MRDSFGLGIPLDPVLHGVRNLALRVPERIGFWVVGFKIGSRGIA